MAVLNTLVRILQNIVAMLLGGRIWVESEFDGKTATCGPNALGMAQSWALQKYIGAARAGQTATTVIYNRMRAAGRCDANGASVLLALNAQAVADGFKTAIMWSASGPIRYPALATWAKWCVDRFKERAGIIMEPSHAAVLRDLLTGKGMDAGPSLAFHYIFLCGYWPGGYHPTYKRDLPEGMFACDGDSDANNPIVGGARTRVIAGDRLQFYSLENLAAAAPYEMMALYSKIPVAPPPPPPPPPPAVPANYAKFLADPEIAAMGWKYGVVEGLPALLANGTFMYKGFGNFMADHPELAKGLFKWNQPKGPERKRTQVELWNPTHGEGAVQDLHLMRLVWTPKDGVYIMWVVDELNFVEQKAGVTE
jgi:hypothetical protein